MALTRPRYSQIPDSDYKNSCRIVTTTDITLSGSAPQTYDGVTLIQYDRVLVTGQTDKTQNGIYSVSTLGSGSNGTWVRSKDANANDRLTAGMNTFIEEGTYSGQFWHLLTPGPIVLGVTELIFGQISGNAAGTSSQVQYNLNGSIAGAANLRYDSVTGNVLIGGGTAATSNVTGALTVNGGIGVTGEIWAQSNIYSAGSRVLTAYDLQTVTFTANYISKDPANVSVPVVGTGTIYGTHNFGNLEAISTYGDYNTTAESGYYSVNDASGAPGFIVYVGFTGITTFNRAVFNINYTQLSGHTVTLDFYNYDTDAWDPFATYSGLGNWQSFALGVIDANPYIDAAGNVTTRVYHVSNGNTAHRTWIDYVALEQSVTGGQGPRGATGATGPSGTYSGGYIIGNVTIGNTIISNSGNISISSTTGALILTGDGGAGIGGNIFAGGNVTANAFYTVNGLFWEGNGLAFSSGLEVSEINTANALSNISTQVTSLRFDKDTGFSVVELDPGNVKISLGSSFKTWHVPGQSDLVAVAEDEVTFFGNGIDITTHPTAPKAITFISNNSILEANIGSFYSYANANIGTLFLGNAITNANLGAYQLWANSEIDSAFLEITYVSESVIAISQYANTNAASQTSSLAAISANLDAFQLYANTKIGTNNNGNLVIQSTTDSVSELTGALVVAGGVGIGGNLYVAGNIFASNLISIGTTTLSVTDPLLYLTASSPSPYNYDIGFYSHFVGGSPTSHYQHTGLARNYATGAWGFFSNVSTEAGATINWSEANLIYDTVRLGDLIVSNTTQSTSTTTGAVRIAGGAGIAGALYINNTGDVSANIGSIYNQLNTLDANIGSYETYANTYLGTAATFTVTNSGSTEYIINEESNPALYLIRGQKYNFSIDAAGHPFWIKTSPSIGIGDQYNDGVVNNGNDTGIVSFTVPLTAPDVLYYVSQFDAAMTNELRVVNFPTLDANIGTLYLGNISTQANLGAFQEYANTSIATLDANIGTLFLGNASTQANLGAYQTYANATFTTYSNANVAAYLPIHTGNISAGNVDVTSNISASKFYTTNGIYWSSNGEPYSTGSGTGITYTASTTPPVGPAVGDQWYDTADGILYEYMDDGDTDQWVDLTSPTFSAANPIAYDTDVTFGSNTTVQGNIFITDGIFWAVNNVSYSTGGGGSFSGADDVLRANVGAYQIYANANIGTLYLGNISTQANLGAYQLYANANLGAQENSINSINSLRLAFNTYANANIGAYQTWANSTFSTSTYSNTNVTAYLTQGVSIGSGSTTTNLVAAATTTSSSTTTGALVVKGGAGIAGALNVGSSGSFAGLLQTTATTAATSTGTGALYVAGGVGIIGNLYAGGNVILGGATTSTNVVVTGTRTSTSTTTGALVVKGGAGIVGAIYGGSTLITSGNIVAGSGSGTTNTTTGALVVVGGAGISGDLRVGNDSYVNNNLSVTQSAYIGEVRVDSSTNSTDVSTGALRLPNGGGIGVTGSVHANRLYTVQGIYWSGNSNPFTVEASNTFGSNLVAASGTPSTSVNTGALVVAGSGGLGVGGDLNATAGSTVNGWTVGGLLWAACTTPATSAISGGGFLVSGDARLVGNVYASGNIILGANTSSNVVANATTTSTSTTTGALVVRGGAGIVGNLYVGSEFVVPGGGKVTSSGLANFFEKANVIASTPPSVVNVDLSTVSVMYWTSNATANITANIRGDADTPLNSILSVGQSVTTALFVPNGASNYYINTIKIDNTTVTAAYSGSSAPLLGNSNSIDIYSFTILKTADATYKVFASQAQFMHPG